jgi:hypothetical protein
MHMHVDMKRSFFPGKYSKFLVVSRKKNIFFQKQIRHYYSKMFALAVFFFYFPTILKCAYGTEIGNLTVPLFGKSLRGAETLAQNNKLDGFLNFWQYSKRGCQNQDTFGVFSWKLNTCFPLPYQGQPDIIPVVHANHNRNSKFATLTTSWKKTGTQYEYQVKFFNDPDCKKSTLEPTYNGLLGAHDCTVTSPTEVTITNALPSLTGPGFPRGVERSFYTTEADCKKNQVKKAVSSEVHFLNKCYTEGLSGADMKIHSCNGNQITLTLFGDSHGAVCTGKGEKITVSTDDVCDAGAWFNFHCT